VKSENQHDGDEKEMENAGTQTLVSYHGAH
jgi:hypothetical protein